MKQNITQERLKQLLHYDLDTGKFARLTKWGSQQVGDEPGGFTPQGYRYIGLDTHQYPAHRLAWLYVHGELPTSDIDHINRLRYDNRISNLRSTTRSINIHNSAGRGRSGVKGVALISPSRQRRSKKIWGARISIDYVEYDLGTFHTIEEATTARKFAESILLNDPRA